MRYLRHVPAPPLNKLVEYLWSLEDTPGHALERIVPSGTLELVINLDRDELCVYREHGAACTRLSGAVVSGAYRRSFTIDTRAHASIVGVHFRPGGASAVLGVPPNALADRHIELADLWPRFATELREQLCGATTAGARFALLERALRERVSSRHDRHAAIIFALDQLDRPAVTVAEVAARLEMSRRRLVELFSAEVGMTPKRMSRVLRLQRLLAQVRASDEAHPWARLATVCGYFDQSHLINEVRELTGLSPRALVAAGARVKDHHLALPDDGNKLPRRTLATRLA